MRRWILLIVTATGVLGLQTLSAEARCPSITKSVWSKAMSNQSLVKLVENKYNGDWSGYTAKWERQLDLARDINARGKYLTLKLKGKLQHVKGDDLREYIETVRERVVVINCLAESRGAAASRTPTVAERKDAGFLKIGKRAADPAGCFKCHNANGISKSASIPHLANQNVGYIVSQLSTFSAKNPEVTGSYGRSHRTNQAMKGPMSMLSVEHEGAVAAYFSSLPCAQPAQGVVAMRPPPSEKLRRACHGAQGVSRSTEIPNLAGQVKLYLVSQLHSFRLTSSGGKKFTFRKRRYHQIMSELAATLTNA